MKRTRICGLCFFCVLALLLVPTTASAEDGSFSDNDCDRGPELSEPLGDTGRFGSDSEWEEEGTEPIRVEQVSDNDADRGPELSEPLGDTGRSGLAYGS